jgi:hypothetical protein
VRSCQAAEFKLSNVPHSQVVCRDTIFSSREEVIRVALSDFATFQFSAILESASILLVEEFLFFCISFVVKILLIFNILS